MKHFPELDLKILLTIEAHSDREGFVDFSGIENHLADQIGYQVGLLGQRGLVEVADTRTLSEPNDWSALRLTYRGHEHLNAIRAPSSSGTAQKESISENTSDGDDPDLVEQRGNYFRRHPIWSLVIIAFGVLMAALIFWKNLTGETLGQSVMRINLLSQETREDCLAKAGKNFVEANKCHQKFPS